MAITTDVDSGAGVAERPVWPTGVWKSSLRRRLLTWYARNGRDLPWRRTSDPYQIWVSEIMLQQTQVATVRPYFARFIVSFPSIEALAQADEQQVLRLWEGLGYYRRARQMHRAAKVLLAEHGGVFPRNLDAVHRLPGIGRYTAGAISSIAFDLRAPILEANTVRLLSRLLAFRGQAASTEGQRLLWKAAEDLLPKKGSGAVNQALMDLGSMICTPKGPRCDQCPLATLCPTNLLGLQDVIPAAKKKPIVEEVREAAIVVRHRTRVLLLRHGDFAPRWAGLWDFPRFPLTAKTPDAADNEVLLRLHQATAVSADSCSRFATIKHGVTRFRITLECYEAKADSSRIAAARRDQMLWLEPRELVDYPLTRTARKIAQMIAKEAAQARLW